jgi:hypothetical protein
MNPTPGDVHVNQLLTNVSIAFMQDQNDFIADKVFPIVPVQNRSNNYTVWDRADWLRDEAKERAPATESAGGGFQVDNTPNYFARVWAWHKDLDDQTMANADNAFNLERLSTEYVTRKLLLRREKLWIATYFGTGIWGTDVTGVSGSPSGAQVKQWNDSTSTPVKDIRRYSRNIQRLTGFRPNVLVLGPDVEDALLDHPDIIDRIKYTQQGFVTEDLLARAFGVDRLLIPGAIVNSAKEGQAGSYDFLFGKGALLCYAAPSPGLDIPSAGYTFAWTRYTNGDGMGAQISRFRMQHLRADRIEGEMAFDMKLTSSELGIFFTTVVA